MTPKRIRDLLEQVRDGALDVGAAMTDLQNLPFEDLGFARIDHHRSVRQGLPEVVFCQGKTTDQVVAISKRIVDSGSSLLATRAEAEIGQSLVEAIPNADYDPLARTVVVRTDDILPETTGTVLVIAAGTSDLPVAEEARVTATSMGSPVETLYDVGVAGIHRLLASRDQILNARVIIVVAGMEGALPSVVGGLVQVPVIAVPTSIGYGASFGGLAALLGMLNSCATGVTVVNIDNGFGAGVSAALINRVFRGPSTS